MFFVDRSIIIGIVIVVLYNNTDKSSDPLMNLRCALRAARIMQATKQAGRKMVK